MSDLPDQAGSISPAATNPRDGAIDFTKYSEAQLEELKYSVDRHTSPQDYAHLHAELERRHARGPDLTSADQSFSGRFTPRDGFLGWLRALGWRSPVYGVGSVQCEAANVTIRGWRRTWLGIAHRDELRLPLGGIRNVAREKTTVVFETKAPYRLKRRVRFTADSEAKASELAAKLPATQTAGFQKQWSELHEFKTRLAEIGGHAWATPVLVLINLAVFVAMAVSARRLEAFGFQFLIGWGANFGSYTVNGQWWRLITALFVHFSLLHLLLNVWALWNAGRLTERLYGTGSFLFLYLASGLLGSLASVAWLPSNVSAGASGAIFGILGAQLAFLAHRDSRIPPQVFRAHWLSTLLFVLFNLIQGALSPGIDNAAHVGGLLGGFVLGWILVRPLDAEAREEFPFHKSVAAALVLCAGVLLALGQVLGFGSQLTGPEKYARAHQWYLNGQGSNLALWQALATQAASGSISDAALGERFEREIVPFWEMADGRLRAESASVPTDEKEYASTAADFTQVRLEWARAIVQATKNRDQSATEESTRLMRQTDLAQARLERLELRASVDHRQRALADSALAVRVRSLFKRGPECVQPPPSWGPIVAPGDSATDGPALRRDAGCRAQRLFLAGDFPALDALMTRAVGTLGDLPDGGSTLDGMVDGLDTLFNLGRFDLPTLLTRTANWRRAVPGSVQPDLMEVIIFRNWAWGARGSGSADQVSQQSWLLFGHRVEMAAAGLRELTQRAADQPLWYQLSLNVGLDQSQDAKTLRAIFDKGGDRFSAYRSLYRAMLRILMPRWGGSYEQVDGFINGVSRGTDGIEDLEQYARLYWIYASLEDDDINVFGDASAIWGPVKAGFHLMEERHPTSDVVVNGFARFACLADDAEQYRQLRPRLTTHYSAAAWSTHTTREFCDQKFRVTDGVSKK
jgi:membrane associated rhomboid family serine protease